MSWKNAIEYKFSPEERAFLLLFDYGVQAATIQIEIIKKLSDYGITSEYESEVLTCLINKYGFTS